MDTWRSSLCIVVVASAVAALNAQVWDPPAITVHPNHRQAVTDPSQRAELIRAGSILFSARFNRRDGAGRPAATGDSKPTPRIPLNMPRFSRVSGPDANSCAGCHNQPIAGGAGDAATNVFVGAHFTDPPAASSEPELTNERGTTALFGAGAIEMVAREMTITLRQIRDTARREAIERSIPVTRSLAAKGVEFGLLTALPDGSVDQERVVGVDPDLVVKPFGAKGVGVSLREFSIAALNQHHGIQAVERFGWERTGRRDFDEDGVVEEFSPGQLSAMVIFQAMLPALLRPIDTAPHGVAARGERWFERARCGQCHRPFLDLEHGEFSEPNPFNRPGTAIPQDIGGSIAMPLPAQSTGSGIQRLPGGRLRVWAYSDLRRHRICDADDTFFCNERLRQDNVPTDEFMTPRLWDLSLTAPYGHRGDCDTLGEVILHHSGEAAESRRLFMELADEQKVELVAFLLTLGARSPGDNGSPLATQEVPR